MGHVRVGMGGEPLGEREVESEEGRDDGDVAKVIDMADFLDSGERR